jgi:hypothetical protein
VLRHAASVATVSAVAVLTAAVSAQQAPEPTIPQQLRATGSFERVLVTTYEPLQLADLVGAADVIVEASTTGGRSFLAQNDTEIYTDYPFQVFSVIKNSRSPELRVGHTITVRRNSGMVILDGRTAVEQENDFPLFEKSERYILFLTRPRGENTYYVFGGPQGAFTLRDRVKQMSTELNDWSTKHGEVANGVFLDELKALLKFSS